MNAKSYMLRTQVLRLPPGAPYKIFWPMAGGRVAGLLPFDRKSNGHSNELQLPDHIILDRLEEIWRWSLRQLGLGPKRWAVLDAVLVVPPDMTAREVGGGDCGCWMRVCGGGWAGDRAGQKATALGCARQGIKPWPCWVHWARQQLFGLGCHGCWAGQKVTALGCAGQGSKSRPCQVRPRPFSCGALERQKQLASACNLHVARLKTPPLLCTSPLKPLRYTSWPTSSSAAIRSAHSLHT